MKYIRCFDELTNLTYIFFFRRIHNNNLGIKNIDNIRIEH